MNNCAKLLSQNMFGIGMIASLLSHRKSKGVGSVMIRACWCTKQKEVLR